jgi:hypothetical protein
MSERVKILLLGPSQTGKSNIANFLSGTREIPTTDYRETAPLRIFEIQLEGLNKKGAARGSKTNVELWDCGGSTKFQNCWPAMRFDADAIIFVVNPEVPNQEKELELWYKNFALPAKIPEKLCLCFVHHSSPPSRTGMDAIPQMPKSLANVRCLETSLDFQSDNFKEAFDQLVAGVLKYRREKEENAMLRDDGMSGPLLVGASQ